MPDNGPMTPPALLVACESFDGELDALQVARAIGRGLCRGNADLSVDLCPVDALPVDFDIRLRGARAVVLAAGHLDHETLIRGGGAFEIATRARQAGVPAYAVTRHNALDLFEMRILDLQAVLEARDAKELEAAGRKLAQLA